MGDEIPLVDDAVGGREEGQNMGDEIPLVLLQLLIPIFQILLQVHLLSSPKARLSLFVHSPDVIILNGEDDESVGVFSEQRLLTEVDRHLTGGDVFGDLLGGSSVPRIFFVIRQGQVLNTSESHFDIFGLKIQQKLSVTSEI